VGERSGRSGGGVVVEHFEHVEQQCVEYVGIEQVEHVEHKHFEPVVQLGIEREVEQQFVEQFEQQQFVVDVERVEFEPVVQLLFVEQQQLGRC